MSATAMRMAATAGCTPVRRSRSPAEARRRSGNRHNPQTTPAIPPANCQPTASSTSGRRAADRTTARAVDRKRRQVVDWWTARERGLPPAMRAAIADRHHEILGVLVRLPEQRQPPASDQERRVVGQLAQGRRRRPVPPAAATHLGERPSSTGGAWTHRDARTLSQASPLCQPDSRWRSTTPCSATS